MVVSASSSPGKPKMPRQMPTLPSDLKLNEVPKSQNAQKSKISPLKHGFSITPLLARAPLRRLDVLPFAVANTVLIGMDMAGFLPNRSFAVTCGLVLILHFSVFLAGQWDVSFRARIGYEPAVASTSSSGGGGDKSKWTHCLVHPPPNSGESSIVEVQRGDRVSIKVQEITFRCDGSTDGTDTGAIFKRLELPVDLELDHYLGSLGHDTATSLVKSQNEFGMNEHQVPSPSFMDCLLPQLIAPFFLFQVFCVMLWSLDEYWYYAIFTLVMLILFECTQAFNRLKSFQRLRNTLRPAYYVLTYRKMKWVPILTDSLVAGDLISLTSRPLSSLGKKEEAETYHQVPCDLLMIRGSAVVNEAMLTGESVPQVKEAVDPSQHAKGVQFDVDDPSFRRNVVFGGTFVVDQSPSDRTGNTEINDTGSFSRYSVPTPTDSGSICYVLRTGFETQQGQLLRTMMFSGNGSNNGVNNYDNFIFILLLLLCALGAASTVIYHTWGDEKRNKFRVVLHVIIILTSVVPPELPMELSLAVTSSLAALANLLVYCTEPFRIPLAGEVDTCCFDKTGTLTSDEMILRGFRCLGPGMTLICANGSKEGSNADLIDPLECTISASAGATSKPPVASKGKMPLDTIRAMVGCQSLTLAKDGKTPIGDPLELAVLKGCGFRLRDNSIVEPLESDDGKIDSVVVHYRFAFESRLKRMTVIARDENKDNMFVFTKGAPEVVQDLCKSTTLPPNYTKVYRYHMSRGQRVLCLAYKDIGAKYKVSDLKKRGRSFLEKDMIFAGFAIFECPLKPDSYRIVNELKSSSHSTVMITGDSALTAAEVARQVGIIDTEPKTTYDLREMKRILPDGFEESAFAFVPIDSLPGEYTPEECIAFVPGNVPVLRDLVNKSELALCISGDAITKVAIAAVKGGWDPKQVQHPPIDVTTVLQDPASKDVLKALVPLISVFARHSPRQKEAVIMALNGAGRTTLMCGDGTNDVGALRQAHVGISILNAPEIESKVRTATENYKKSKKKSLQDLADAQQDLVQVALGDASMASPFTSRTMSIKCCKDILLRGRCTLVTMLQIYKILGVNCLVNALVLTNLHMHGVKQGDRQLTVMGLVVAALFLFVTKGKPLNSLASKRPPSSVLCLQALISIATQFLIHLVSILAVANMTLPYIDPDDPSITPDGPFNPNTLNTACFLILMSATVNTFIVNYRGRPFMQTFKQNKLLLRTVQVSFAALGICVLEIFEPLNRLMQFAPLPGGDFLTHIEDGEVNVYRILSVMLSWIGFKATLIVIMVFDSIVAFKIEKLIIKAFEG